MRTAGFETLDNDLEKAKSIDKHLGCLYLPNSPATGRMWHKISF